MNTILLFVLRLFTACPGILKISGKIISDKDETPIEGAKIELLDCKQIVHTDPSFLSDKNGNFAASSVMRKMILGLPTYKIIITKSGYQILEVMLNLKSTNRQHLFKLIEN